MQKKIISINPILVKRERICRKNMFSKHPPCTLINVLLSKKRIELTKNGWQSISYKQRSKYLRKIDMNQFKISLIQTGDTFFGFFFVYFFI